METYRRSISVNTMIFSITFIKAWLILNQNNMHCWWIEIKKNPEYKFYNNIGDVLVKSFWYHSNDTRRNTWVMYVHIAQLRTHSAICTLPFTMQLCCKPLGILQRVKKSQKIHTAIHHGLQKLHNINLALQRSPLYIKLF